MTRCEIDENHQNLALSTNGIHLKNRQSTSGRSFLLDGRCATGLLRKLAPSSCGGKQAASAICCGTFVDCGDSGWGWAVEWTRMVWCIWMEVCCGARN